MLDSRQGLEGTEMRQTITCECGGTIAEHWQVFVHIHWQPSPRHTGLKARIQSRLRHYGYLRTRQR
jgi:hypothetical protein